MKKGVIIAISISAILVIGGGIAFGYFLLNPLGGANEDLTPGTIQKSGTFVEIDGSHYGSGTANIVVVEVGAKELQFVNVNIANGPDLYVYLSYKSTFSGTGDDTGIFVDLGLLPYNSGNFSIPIHSSTDTNNYNSVLIWCLQFSVVFTYATLA